MDPISEIRHIVVKRKWLDAFLAGEKTAEYRIWSNRFNDMKFAPGTEVRIRCQYNSKPPILKAVVDRTEASSVRDHPFVRDAYPDVGDDAKLCIIHLRDIALEVE